jgi:hypothetical protein
MIKSVFVLVSIIYGIYWCHSVFVIDPNYKFSHSIGTDEIKFVRK